MAGLGYAGLVPFYVFAGLSWVAQSLPQQQFAVQGFSLYALAILAFLAGTLWGSANVRVGPEKQRRLLISNALTVAGVLALMLAHPVAGALALALLHLCLYYYEAAHTNAGWYLRLRQRLTWGSMPAYLAFVGGQLLA